MKGRAMSARRKRPDPVGWLTGRDAMWTAIRALGLSGPFRLAEVVDRTRQNKATIRSFLIGLWRAGVLSATPPERRGDATLYALANDPGSETPRLTRDGGLDTAPTHQERLWLAMKPLGSFTAPELVMACGNAVTNAQASSYIGRLAAAGYLVETEPCRTVSGQNRRARYALRMGRDTGPRPPAVRRDKTVFDLNLGRVVGREDVL